MNINIKEPWWKDPGLTWIIGFISGLFSNWVWDKIKRFQKLRQKRYFELSSTGEKIRFEGQIEGGSSTQVLYEIVTLMVPKKPAEKSRDFSAEENKWKNDQENQ